MKLLTLLANTQKSQKNAWKTVKEFLDTAWPLQWLILLGVPRAVAIWQCTAAITNPEPSRVSLYVVLIISAWIVAEAINGEGILDQVGGFECAGTVVNILILVNAGFGYFNVYASRVVSNSIFNDAPCVIFGIAMAANIIIFISRQTL